MPSPLGLTGWSTDNSYGGSSLAEQLINTEEERRKKLLQNQQQQLQPLSQMMGMNNVNSVSQALGPIRAR